MKQKSLNLYLPYEKAVKSQKARSRLPSWVLPLSLSILGPLALWGMNFYACETLSDELEQTQAQISEPQTAQRYERALGAAERHQQLLMNIGETRRLLECLEQYPQLDTPLMEYITNMGGEEVRNHITAYDAPHGLMTFHATSKQVIDIPDYIHLLMSSGCFQEVSYLGYTYQEHEGLYSLSLSAVLKPGLKT